MAKRKSEGRVDFSELVREYSEESVPEKVAAELLDKFGIGGAGKTLSSKEAIARVLLHQAAAGDKSAVSQVSEILGGTGDEVARKIKRHMEKLYALLVKRIKDPGVCGVMEDIFEEYFQKLDL